MVFSGLVTAWRLATWPTRRLPSLVKATTEGVVRPPSELVITVGSPPSITATTELVVPRSIPIILLIILVLRIVELNACLAPTKSALPDYYNGLLVGVERAVNIIPECVVVNFN